MKFNIKTYILFCFNLVLCLNINAAQSTFEDAKTAGGLASSLKESASGALAEAGKQLKLFLDAVKDLGTRLGKVKYDEADTIEILTSANQTKAMGFVIKFKDKGHANLDNLNGISIDLRFGSMFDSLGVLGNPIRDQAINGLKSLVGGTVSKDPETGRSTLLGNPTMEFVFKTMILAKGFADKDPVGGIDEKTFGLEMALLLARLAKTPGVKDVKDALKSVPGPLRSVLQGIRIQGQSIEDYLSALWEEIKFAVTYDFTKKDTTPIGNDDIKIVVRILSAIICRAGIDYVYAKDRFMHLLASDADIESLKATSDGQLLGLGDAKDLKGFWAESKKIYDKKASVFEKIEVAQKNKQIALDTKKADTEKKLLVSDIKSLDDTIKKSDTAIKTLADELKKTADELDKKFKTLPIITKIKNDAQKRVLDLVTRFGAYRKLRQTIIDKVSPIVDVILAPVGLKLADILPGDNQLPPEKKALQEAEAEDILMEQLGEETTESTDGQEYEEYTEGTEPTEEYTEESYTDKNETGEESTEGEMSPEDTSFSGSENFTDDSSAEF